ncbi:MAG: hypothetical protein R3362_10020 [Rhodothermales bacterium]|nr:hypothetical protein [Rhodothermales bacterium]
MDRVEAAVRGAHPGVNQILLEAEALTLRRRARARAAGESARVSQPVSRRGG